MREPELIEIVVQPAGHGARIDRYLADQIEGLSRARAQALIRDGQVALDDAEVAADQRVYPGQQIRVEIPAPVPAAPIAEQIDLEVLYEDDDLVVLNKAAGMVVHPAPGHPTGTLVNALLGRYGDAFSVGGEVRPGIVHRLDKGTSGVMIVARHDAALVHLQDQFQRRSVDKRYLAVVRGDPGPSGELDTPYGRHPRDRKRFTSKLDASPRRALLSYTRRERWATASLIEVRLQTGRTHQIRVQMSEQGFPLLGDPSYGRGARHPAIERPALHSWRLCCAHPIRGEALQFEAPLPADLRGLIDALRGGTR